MRSVVSVIGSVAVVLPCVLQGCGGDEGGSPSENSREVAGLNDSSNDDPLSGVLDRGVDPEALPCDDPQPDAEALYREFYDELQTLYCERQFECCSEEERGPLADDTVAGCLATVGNNIRDVDDRSVDSMECGRIRFLPDVAASCLEELRSATCMEVTRLPDCVLDFRRAEKRLLWEPRSQTGELCEAYSFDCIDGYCDTGMELTGIGRCAPLKPTGAACTNSNECAGGSCRGSDGCAEVSRSASGPFCDRF